MRDLMNLFEAKNPSVATIDPSAVADHIRTLSKVLTRPPFSLKWQFEWATAATRSLQKIRAGHENEADFDATDYIMEEADAAFRAGAFRTFDLVKADIEHQIREYQKHQGQNMDDEAGFASDFHYVESSDWLTAMEAQRDLAKSLSHDSLGSLATVASMVSQVERFIETWKVNHRTDQGSEAILTDDMHKGLAELMPLLLMIAKAIAR